MTEGNIETVNYYTIKIGSLFLESIKKGFDFDEEKRTCRSISSSSSESYARKWQFNELSENETSDEYHIRKDFLETYNLLKAQGTQFKVLKTTTVTTVEQKEVLFIDGKEKELERLAVGGLVSGKSVVLHNDFIINKGNAEKLFVTTSYKEAIEALNKEIKSLQDSQIKFPIYSKQYQDALKAEIELQKEKKSVLEPQSVALEEEILVAKTQKYMDEIYRITKESGIAIGESLKSVLPRIPNVDKANESAETIDEEKVELFDSIYKICQQAIKDSDDKKASEFMDSLSKMIKNNKGLR